MRYHAVLSQEKDWIVAICPELDVASEGKTVEEAMRNLKEAVELYLEDEDVESFHKESPGKLSGYPLIKKLFEFFISSNLLFSTVA